MPNKVDFKGTYFCITREIEDYFILMKGSVDQEDIKIVKAYVHDGNGVIKPWSERLLRYNTKIIFHKKEINKLYHQKHKLKLAGSTWKSHIL